MLGDLVYFAWESLSLTMPTDLLAYNNSHSLLLPAGRSSKAVEEPHLYVPGMGKPNPAETRAADTAILNVVEAYCTTARLKTLIRKQTV